MYMLIDRGQMAIIYKHKSKEILSALDWITCQNSAVYMACGDTASLMQFNILELQQLYLNATGHKMLSIHTHMARLVADASMRMQDTVVNGDPVAACKKISAADKRHFIWDNGQAVPHNQVVLPTPIKVDRNLEAEADNSFTPHVSIPVRPIWRPTAADQAAVGALPHAAPVARAVRDPSEPRAQRSSGIRDTIYSVADRIWEDAGKPTDKTIILKLRKQMMEELENTHSVKRNTSSNSLGDWQKLRIPA